MATAGIVPGLFTPGAAAQTGEKLAGVRKSPFSTDEALTPYDVEEIIADVCKRPFITLGFLSFVLLIPLAITSTTKMIQCLGGKWWQRLHCVVYVIAIGGVVHYLWLVKADVQQPLFYGALLVLLLIYRVRAAYGRRPKPWRMPRRQAAMSK